MALYSWKNGRSCREIPRATCHQACDMLVDEMKAGNVFIVYNSRLEEDIRIPPTPIGHGYECKETINAIALAVQAEKMNTLPAKRDLKFYTV